TAGDVVVGNGAGHGGELAQLGTAGVVVGTVNEGHHARIPAVEGKQQEVVPGLLPIQAHTALRQGVDVEIENLLFVVAALLIGKTGVEEIGQIPQPVGGKHHLPVVV